MGYYTYFDITVSRFPVSNRPISEDELKSIKQDIADISGYDFGHWEESCYCRNGYNLVQYEHLKWYECDKDILEVSINHPGILFTIYGDGEESGDMWYSYIYEGKIQKDPAEIRFVGFKPELLE